MLYWSNTQWSQKMNLGFLLKCLKHHHHPPMRMHEHAYFRASGIGHSISPSRSMLTWGLAVGPVWFCRPKADHLCRIFWPWLKSKRNGLMFWVPKNMRVGEVTWKVAFLVLRHWIHVATVIPRLSMASLLGVSHLNHICAFCHLTRSAFSSNK